MTPPARGRVLFFVIVGGEGGGKGILVIFAIGGGGVAMGNSKCAQLSPSEHRFLVNTKELIKL